MKRNEAEPCSPCVGKSTGIGGLVRAVAYGPADARTQEARMLTCQGCPERGGDGERLFREIDGKHFCGIPRPFARGTVPTLEEVRHAYRDETVDGCGCELEFKTSRAEADCPKGLWAASSVRVKRTGGPVKSHLVKALHGGIGDAVTAMCVVAGVKERYPERHICFAMPDHRIAWAKLFSDADEILDLRRADRQRWDYVSEIRIPEWKEEHALEITRHASWANGIGVMPAWPRLNLPEAALSWAAGMVGFSDVERPVILAPFATNACRTWPIHRWVELEARIRDRGIQTVVLDGPGDGARTNVFNGMRYWGYGAIHTAAMIARSRVVIGNDSGLTHLAAAMGVPTVAICGPSSARSVFGFYPYMKLIQSGSCCSECYLQPKRGFRSWCLNGCDALWDVSAYQVFRTVDDWGVFNQGEHFRKAS